jgi:hypothetical protein
MNWVVQFDGFIEQIMERKMRGSYVITLETVVRNTVIVDAKNEDEAIDYAIDLLDYKDNDYGEWEVSSVDFDYD